MKKRIVALILVIATSLLTLVGCFGSVDAAKIDYVGDGYATFDAAAFDAGIKNIVIEDGTFTTNEATRTEKTAAEIYKKVADAIASAAGDADKLTEGELGANDILYFVYYAVNEATGDVYFTADMKESAITSSTTKDKHVVQLGGDYTADDKEFIKLVQENVTLGAIDEYIYKMDADAVSASDFKPADGDVLYISYTRTYNEKTEAAEGEEEGTSAIVTQSASYEKITITAGDALSDKLIAGEKEFELELDGVTYNYKDVKFLWKVESEGKAIATFEYTPYTASQAVTPDNLRKSDATKPELKDVALTYYVFPVNYVKAYAAPNADEVKGENVDYSITAAILRYVYGSKLTEDSFDVLSDEGFTFEGEKVTDLVNKIADLFTPVVDTADESKTGDFYKKDSELRKLYDAHADAVKVGGSSPTDEQQDAIDDAKEALTNAQNAELDKIVAKLAKAENGEEKADALIYNQYLKDTYYDLATAYNEHVKEAVESEVWDLIEKTVTIKGYPEKLLKEFTDHVYEEFEYNYNTGAQTTGDKLAFVDLYSNIEEYVKSKDCTLKVTAASSATLDEIVKAEAKYYLDPIIRIFVVSRHVEAAASAALPGFYQHDMDKGAYDIHLEDYTDAYGEEKGQKKYEEALEQNEEQKQFILDNAASFLVDNDYLKAYKKYVGKSSYNLYLENYGEINLRASEQFSRLFYYLTSTDITPVEEGRHEHTNPPAYTEADENGVIYLAFRTVEYTTEGETEVEADDDHDDHDH